MYTSLCNFSLRYICIFLFILPCHRHWLHFTFIHLVFPSSEHNSIAASLFFFSELRLALLLICIHQIFLPLLLCLFLDLSQMPFSNLSLCSFSFSPYHPCVCNEIISPWLINLNAFICNCKHLGVLFYD